MYKTLKNNGIDYQPQLVQEYFHQQYLQDLTKKKHHMEVLTLLNMGGVSCLLPVRKNSSNAESFVSKDIDQSTGVPISYL